MAAAYTIRTRILATPEKIGIKWCLDTPEPHTSFTNEQLKFGIIFSGWVLETESKQVQPALRCGDEFVNLELNVRRPDVIKKILNQDTKEHPKVVCGFKFSIPLPEACFTFGVLLNNEFFPLLEGQVEGLFKVIHGNDDWLFLDNDSNKSVEQYTGKLLLSWSQRRHWKRYFKDVTNLSKKENVPCCMIIAPSKEMVYPEHYPYSPAKKTPITQLSKLIPDTFEFIYPVEMLKGLKKRAYRKSDTHWTLHAAREASIIVANKLSDSNFTATSIFHRDRYKSHISYGDLGAKTYPRIGAREDMLNTFHYNQLVKFDNQLRNFGRVIIFHRQQPRLNKSLLLFGSSSAYSMFHYLARIFKTVVFIHSAGNVDPEVVKVVQPDYMCMQSNARFIIKAPTVEKTLESYIERKRQATPKEMLSPPLISDDLPPELQNIVSYFATL